MSLLEKEDLIDEGLATITSRAKYFTINVEERIGPDYRKEQLFIELSCNHNFEIFVHDPRFFTLNYIPVAFPALQRTLLVNTTESHFYAMVMTEVDELDLAQDPCNQDKEYNFQVSQLISHQKVCCKATVYFTYFNLFYICPSKSVFQDNCIFQACISESVTKMLGCKPQWEPLASDTTLPPCTSVAEFRWEELFPNYCAFVLPEGVQWAEEQDFQHGDGRNWKTDRLHEALPLQGGNFQNTYLARQCSRCRSVLR